MSAVITKLAGSNRCDRWIGLAIEIYPTNIYAFGENHDVVRISPKRPTADQAKAAGAHAQQQPDPEPPANDMEVDEIREGPPASTAPAISEDEAREILAREAKEAAK